MPQPRPAVHRTVVVVDVEGFGDRCRANPDQLAVREGLYRSLRRAFGAAGIGWDECDREDRGDGVLILAPPQVPKAPFAESLPRALAAALCEHNGAHPAQQRIRLRMALHAGEVSYDAHGVTAASVNLAFRLVDAPALKTALAGSQGVLALIVSAWFFDEVVRNSPVADPATYRPVSVAVKETVTEAWICRPDHPYPADDAVFGQSSGGLAAPGPTEPPAAVPNQLGDVADQLAAAVARQWHAEAAVRRLNDPYPLPVRWTAADPSLADDWATLLALARSGAGRPPAPPSHVWAGGPAELAGEGGQLAEVLARVPTGRLVVLGEPGAGKTVLMVRLVLDLLARRASGGPVPVLFPVASWAPASQDLRGWLEGRLRTGYPWLAGPAPRGGPPVVTQARALLEAGLVMAVLDGLDEIPAAARGPAIAKINDAVRPGEHLVVTSRTAHWRAAVRPPGGTEVRLRGAAAITLCPLDTSVVAGYLRADAGGPNAAARWDPVVAALQSQPLLARVLSSPLMASLARTVYNPRPGEYPAPLPDPAELCGNPAAEAHLLGGYIPAAYRARPHRRAGRRPESPQQAGKWLTFLAHHLEHTVKAPELAWWQLARSLPVTGYPYAFVMTLGIMCGVQLAQWSGISPSYGLVIGSPVAHMWYLALQQDRQPSYGISWAGLRRLGMRRLAALAALAAALAAVVAKVHGNYLKSNLLVWVLLAIQLLVTQSLKGGLPGDLTVAPSPKAVLIRDRRTGLAAMLSAVLVGAAAGALLLRGDRMPRLAPVPAGVMAGAVVGVAVSAFVSAWPRWVIARAWFALRRRLPWRLMTFLTDAHQRGVLRQDGAVYQFRHIELQHQLAAHPPPRLAKVADRLAAGVRCQWQAQAWPGGAGGQRLLPLRWVPADPSLAVPWDDLVTAATSGASWPAPHAPDAWARSPQELAGEGDRLAGVLDQVPTGRLVLLGEPGAGKTTLMTRLMLDLLAHRASGDPVPVLVPAAAWDPAGQDLREWLVGQLMASHPALARKAPPVTQGPTRADALLAAGLILPILDGLDEIPPAARGPAITRISHALRPGHHLVVTSRAAQWQQAAQRGSLLDAAAVIQLCPLDGTAAADYLRTSAHSRAEAARWDPVITALARPGPLAQALSSPLMAGLAQAAYAADGPAPGIPEPAQLCAPATQAAIEHHLLDAFITAACRPRPSARARDRRRAGQAEKWLMFLAHHLDKNINSPCLAWWQLSQAVPGPLLSPTFPVTAGLALGIAAALTSGPWWGLGAGLAGLAAGTLASARLNASAAELKQPSSPWRRYRTSPRATLRDARVRALAAAAGIVGVTVLVIIIGGNIVNWPVGWLVGWLALRFMNAAHYRNPATAAWPRWLMSRAWLARRHLLPWRLMTFLTSACEHGVLRQTGPVYQFHHIELQHRLATRMQAVLPPVRVPPHPHRPGPGLDDIWHPTDARLRRHLF